MSSSTPSVVGRNRLSAVTGRMRSDSQDKTTAGGLPPGGRSQRRIGAGRPRHAAISYLPGRVLLRREETTGAESTRNRSQSDAIRGFTETAYL